MSALLADDITVTTVNDRKVWNTEFYKKAVEFNFIGKDGVESVFQFSLPPQNVELSYQQRIIETKTFGGSVIDDYGNDVIGISVQGTTANSNIRSYIMNGSKRQGTGIDEIYDFKKLLSDYGKIDNLKSKKVLMYYENFVWRVYVKTFAIKQTKENPLSLIYTIELLGQDDSSETSAQKQTAGVQDSGSTHSMTIKTYDAEFCEATGVPELAVYKEETQAGELLLNGDFPDDSIAGVVNFTENELSFFDSVKNICSTIRGSIARAGNAILNWSNQVYSHIDEVTSTVKEVQSLGDFVVSTAIRTADGVVDSGMDSINELVNSIDSGVKFFTDFPDTYGSWPSDIEERLGKKGDDLTDTFRYMFMSSKNKAEKLKADYLLAASTTEVAIIPGGSDTDDKAIPISGSIPRTTVANETCDSIAAEVYGDADMGVLIATYNSSIINTDEEVVNHDE